MQLDSLSLATVLNTENCMEKDTLIALDPVFAEAKQVLEQEKIQGQRYMLTLPPEADKLRWFVLPQEIPEANPEGIKEISVV